MKEIYQFAQETKKQLKREDIIAKRKVTKPKGMPDLSTRYGKLQDEVWNQQLVEADLQPNALLANELTDEELLQNAVAVEANEIYENKRLNTESLQTLLDPKGWMTSEAIGYFCKVYKRNTRIPSLFI